MNVEERLFLASLSNTNRRNDMNDILEYFSNLLEIVKRANPNKIDVLEKYEDNLIHSIIKEGINNFYASKIKKYIPYEEEDEVDQTIKKERM